MNRARAPRVAFFTDSYHEVNGVARTSRQFVQFAAERQLPMLSVHPGPETREWSDGAIQTFELRNSRFSLRLEASLKFDLLFARHIRRMAVAFRAFQPDLVHITGPAHCGILATLLAHHFQVPLVASWHTNVHEFGTRRLRKIMRFLPWSLTNSVADWTERRSLDLLLMFYGLARLHFAPNPDLTSLLAAATQKPCYLMRRGIDTELFSPYRRTRTDQEFVIGYVGRLSPEKDVRLLAKLERKLIHAGVTNYRFLVVGDGSDRPYLQAHLHRAHLPGTLLGLPLSEAYANMDVFVFPSETDTFGNVVLEALASGVPAIVSSGGGPQYIIRHGITGMRTSNIDEITAAVLKLYRNRRLLAEMAAAARRQASEFSWDNVFEGVYSHYGEVLQPSASEKIKQTSVLATR